MKKGTYVKFTLLNKTDEDVLNNMFVAYLIGIVECVIFAILIGELNLMSIGLLVTAAILLCVLAYKKGTQDASKY